MTAHRQGSGRPEPSTATRNAAKGETRRTASSGGGARQGKPGGMELEGEWNEIGENSRQKTLDGQPKTRAQQSAHRPERNPLREMNGKNLRHRPAQATQDGHGS
jgi:hypothetical protein